LFSRENIIEGALKYSFYSGRWWKNPSTVSR